MLETGEAPFLLILNTREKLAKILISQLAWFMGKAEEIMAIHTGTYQGIFEEVTVS